MKKASKLEIRSTAFYRNSLTIKREMKGKSAIASGHYLTRYGTVHLYGENYPLGTGRKPFFSFEFTYQGRNYQCSFIEWLTDATIRLRALRFVEECVCAPTPIHKEGESPQKLS